MIEHGSTLAMLRYPYRILPWFTKVFIGIFFRRIIRNSKVQTHSWVSRFGRCGRRKRNWSRLYHNTSDSVRFPASATRHPCPVVVRRRPTRREWVPLLKQRHLRQRLSFQRPAARCRPRSQQQRLLDRTCRHSKLFRPRLHMRSSQPFIRRRRSGHFLVFCRLPQPWRKLIATLKVKRISTCQTFALTKALDTGHV